MNIIPKSVLFPLLLVPLALPAADANRLWTVGTVRCEPSMSKDVCERQLRLITNPVVDGVMVSQGGWIRTFSPKGELVWEITSDHDQEVQVIDGTPSGTMVMRGVLHIIDLKTGGTLWTIAGNDPVFEKRKFAGYVPVPELKLMLLLSKSAVRNGQAVFAVEMDSGKILWKSSEILLANDLGMPSVPEALDMLHPAIVDDDGIILYLDSAGPVKVDPATGQVLWRSYKIQKAVFGSGTLPEVLGDPNWVESATPPMMRRGGILYVPVGTAVQAFDTKTGNRLWSSGGKTGSLLSGFGRMTIHYMEFVEKGLLIAGWQHDQKDSSGNSVAGRRVSRGQVDILDPQTGKSLLGDRPQKVFGTMDAPVVSKVIGNSYVMAGYSEAYRYDLGDNSSSKLTGKFFGKRQEIGALDEVEGKVLLHNPRNATLYDQQNKAIYDKYFEAPKKSLARMAAESAAISANSDLQNLLNDKLSKVIMRSAYRRGDTTTMAAQAATYERNKKNIQASKDTAWAKVTSERFDRSASTNKYLYFFVEKKTDSKVPVIVRVDKATGDESKVIEVDTNSFTIDYMVDEPNRRVYVRDGKQIFAQAFIK